jgi:hypothetical protein
VIRKQPRWCTEAERHRLLEGMFEMQPRWYAFFYLTTRLGLRTGEVYAISRDRVRNVPPNVDRRSRRSAHVDQGYAGPQFLFSQDGTFPKHLDSHKRPLRTVQKALGLPCSLTTRSVAIRWPARLPRGVSRSEPSRLNSGTAPPRAPRCMRTWVAVLNCASFRRSNQRHRPIVVNIWSTRGQLEMRRTRNHS